MKYKLFRFRSQALLLLSVLLTAGFFVLLYDAQIRHGIDIDASTAANTIVTRETVEAARGEITDRYGRVLVSNQTVYHAVLDVGAMGDYSGQVATIRRLIAICRTQGIEWNQGSLPLEQTESGWQYTTDTPFLREREDGTQTETSFAQLCQTMEWPMDGANPGRVAGAMLRTFGLTGAEDAYEVLDVLYACYLREKEIVWTTWYFAQNVEIDFITVVKEEDLPGITIKAATERVYYTDCAAHLLGQVGLIAAEDWEEGENYKERGYEMDATVGQSGVEYAFEDYLRGTSGVAQRITDLEGNLLDESYVELPVAGSNVALTLDIKLQEAAELSLERHTEEINGGEGGSAVVVLDVRDGSVLAAASWPTYDLSRYRQDYNELVQDSLKPLYNRAFLGTYAPGSTYKLVTATAALDTGLISTTDTIRCTGWMEYLDTTFRCWIYRQNGGTHGVETVSDAIRDSCNIFFYTVGSQLGIDTLTEYAQAYGLGLPTGIELSESTGVNAGPEYSERLGMIWYPGNTLSAAIGQSDNQFTPLQICNYLATVVNGGSRYSAHLLKSVKSHDNTQLIEQYAPEVVNQVPLSDSDRGAILEGMAQVVESTAAVREAFAGLAEQGVQVGAKTGSAQVSGQENANGLFVCFAPYDDPEVAVCVAVEKGGSGAATSVIAADILEYYFSDEAVLERVDRENQLLR